MLPFRTKLGGRTEPCGGLLALRLCVLVGEAASLGRRFATHMKPYLSVSEYGGWCVSPPRAISTLFPGNVATAHETPEAQGSKFCPQRRGISCFLVVLGSSPRPIYFYFRSTAGDEDIIKHVVVP